VHVPLAVFIAQWVLTTVFGVFLVLLFRQVAHLLRLARVESGRARIAIGESVPAFSYRIYGAGESIAYERGAAGLLLFVEPTCSSCVAAVEWLRTTLEADDAAQIVEPLVLTSASDDTVRRVPGLIEGGVQIGLINEGIASDDFGIDATPFVVASDGDGTVSFCSPVSTIDDIRTAVATLGRDEERAGPHTGQVAAALS
jgi:hypothetical protein